MNISLDYIEAAQSGRITAADSLPASTWARLTSLATRVQPDAKIAGKSIELEWISVLTMATRLADLRRELRFKIEYSTAAKTQLQRFREEYDAIRTSVSQPSLSEDSVQQELARFGFTRRPLKGHQRRDIVRMASLRNGANFSVPGAGKTTVAFAVHLLAVPAEAHLLVVAPKNAFTAWDEVIKDCLDPSDPNSDTSPFVRLEGGTDAIRSCLREAPRRLIISYDQLIRVSELISDFLRAHPVHVIVDESHRMKSGLYSLRGEVLLALAHLPVRRDILSGTPVPNDITDIGPQVDFLWPGQGIGRRVASGNAASILRPLYVRTTKNELRLPPVKRKYERIPMSRAQLALYSLMRDAILARRAGLQANSNIDFINARRSVLRLLQVSSNPILAVRALTTDEPENFPYDDQTVEAIFAEIVQENDSPKMLRAVSLTDEILASSPEARVVIWSTFRDNVERLSELLGHHGATYIHGDVPVGDSADISTREGRIAAFHANHRGCRVLVANPAACSEGISLHRVCHNAIYLDRSFNAAHYLQSVDRIHRLGLPDDVETTVHVLESIAPGVIGAIDLSVRRRLITKLQMMASALEDEDLRLLAIDEQEGEDPLDYGIEHEDIMDVIEELSGTAAEPDEEVD